MEWFSLNELVTMAVISMPFAIIFGANSAFNVISDKEYGLWETIIHLAWLITMAFALVSWPVVLFAASIGIFSTSDSVERSAFGAGIVMSIAVIAVSLLPFMVLPFRGKKPMFGKRG